MATTPAAGKQQSAPKTPTKLARKPGQTPQKLSQSTSKPPLTPKALTAKKPQAESPKPLAKAQGVAEEAGGKARDIVESAKPPVEDASEDAQSRINLQDNDNEEEGKSDDVHDEPLSNVKRSGNQAKNSLEEAAPVPVDDSDYGSNDLDNNEAENQNQNSGDDLASDAPEQAEEGAQGAKQKISNRASSATGTVGKASKSAKETKSGGQSKPQQQKGGLLKGAQGLAGKASGLANKAPNKAKATASDTIQDPQSTPNNAIGDRNDAASDVQDDMEDADDDTQDVDQDESDEALNFTNGITDGVEHAKDTVEDTVEDPEVTTEDAVEDATEGAEDTSEHPQELAEDIAQGAQDEAEDTVDNVQDEVEDEADDVQRAAEDSTKELPSMPEGLPLDMSVLKGLEVQEDGIVSDDQGNAIGRLAEGDAEDLAGYPIGDDGEILDDDGDLVGRVELSPDQIKKQLNEAKEQGIELPEGADEYLSQLNDATANVEGQAEDAIPYGLPGLHIMEGLSCQVDGLIYDDDGNTIGRVVDGDPQELQNATLNSQGEFIDEEGNVVGRAQIHDDAAELVQEGIYEAADEAQEDIEDAVGETEDVAEDAADETHDAAGDATEAVEGIEDELPGIEALEGRELNEIGEIVDDQGDVLGQIEDEDLRQKIADGEIDPATLQINEEGEVVDEDGNILGKTELVEGAAQKLAEGGPLLDLRILEGRKVNKKGKILDEDGEEIGELRDGELKDCTGKKVNDKGEVLDKQGNVVGRVGVTRGEAAENATRELLEELGELQSEEPETPLPDLSVLEGYKVNKKGQILNEDGETIGELVEGELTDCAGKKVNDQGEVVDKEGNVVGRVQTLPDQQEEQQVEEEVQLAEDGQAEGQDHQEAEEGDQLPPLSVLDGLTVNKAGRILDANGTIIGELVEGDAKKLSKSRTTCDAEGKFWDNKGHVIGQAKTIPVEEAEEEAPFAGLEGLHVVDDGYVQDENGNTVGYVTEGNAKKLIGRVVDEDGDILDKKGSVVGHAERYEEPEAEEEAPPEEADLSFLQGKTVNKAGLVIGDEGVPVAQLVEGKAKEVTGRKLDSEGKIWNDRGQVIGRVELIPEEERDSKPEGPFAGLEGLRVIDGGKVADEDGNVVGEITEGNPKRLVGLAVDEDGDIVDKYGNVKGHAEPVPEEEEEQAVDNSLLDGKQLNKQGYVVDESGIPFGRLIEGNISELAGRRCDENGYIHSDTGKVVGRCELIPENERVHRPEGPFAGLEGLRVVKEGKVEDEDGNVVGEIVEGNAKRLVGMAVDEDGDILDKFGNVKGHAEPYEEPEEEEEQPEDLSTLASTTINKHGNAVNGNGQIIGRVVEGEVKSMIGKKVDGQGQIWDNAGNVVGRCELVRGEDTSPEGPFAGFQGLQIKKDGTVVTGSNDIVGRIIEGDIKKLMGHTVDEEGDIVDKNGNTIGRAERWEPEEKERRANLMSGMRVNKEGEVRDSNGDLIGRLTQGDLGHCVGQEIDDSGNVVDVDGNKIGEVTLLENIAEDEYEGPTEEELEEASKREEERKIAEKMGGICSQTLERMQPICKQISDHMETADRTPKEELDEEDLVNKVKPLIEEGGRILQECNGSLRGLDPDGKIAAQAKGRAGTGEATPEEYRLAETLKELTTTVVTTIDNAKKRLNSMPHAKKKLNPLWSLLTQPLFQILAAVGLLLAGVLGLVGQLLNALGLGGLVNGLLGGLGMGKLLSSFGLGGGGDKKKSSGKSALGNIPVVGGLLGGGK